VKDVKQTPPDFVVGDLSHSESKPGPWCSEHGYYNCPVCAGEEPRWVFPSEVALHPIDTWAGTSPSDTPHSEGVDLPPESWPQVTAAAGLGVDVPAAPAQDQIPLRANPGLRARVRRILGE